MQLNLYGLTDGTNPVERTIFRDVKIHIGRNASAQAMTARNYLGITEDNQLRDLNYDK
jgi:hypothetical protein